MAKQRVVCMVIMSIFLVVSSGAVADETTTREETTASEDVASTNDAGKEVNPPGTEPATVSEPGSDEASVVQLVETELGDPGKIVYLSNTCTATVTCPGSSPVSCTGTCNGSCTPDDCKATTKNCPDGGSSCPDQGGPVSAVWCDGQVRDHCPCPEICYGCGVSCNFPTDCGVCTCGPPGSGFCNENDECECLH